MWTKNASKPFINPFTPAADMITLNPHLPPASETLTPHHTRRHRVRCGAAFYLACLELSQSLHLQQKPAQALLQLNKAFLADLGGEPPPHPLPYAALLWYLTHRDPTLFLGNPVRHFQHLATRISGPRALLRSWRAWACFHLAETVLPHQNFPRDFLQLEEERITVPSWTQVKKNLPPEDLSCLAKFR